MDDRTWYLAIGSLVTALIGIFLDAALSSFQVPAGMWAFLSAILGFLGARSAMRGGSGRWVNGNDVDQDQK